jgi:hypothetical protein
MRSVNNEELIRHMKKYRIEGDQYIPIDQSSNKLRHFGLKREQILYLHVEEVLYLFTSDPSLIEDLCKLLNIEDRIHILLVYYFFKNNDYNLIRSGEFFLLYRHVKHFNRKKDSPMGELFLVHKNELFKSYCGSNFERRIFCINSEKIFTSIIVTEIKSLSLGCDEKLLKSKKD